MQLQATNVGACEKPQLTRGFNPKTDDGTEKAFQAQIDIAVAALASDAARVATITFGNEGNNHIVPTWLGILAGNSAGYFRTGQAIEGDFQNTDVLNAVCEAVGVDIAGYTQPEYRGVLAPLKA